MARAGTTRRAVIAAAIAMIAVTATFNVIMIVDLSTTAPWLVHLGDDGRLVYAAYANQGETEAVNVVPDFSHAGFDGGGVPLPDVPVASVLDPVPGDNRAHIQAAIDALAAQPLDGSGARGAILLNAGSYPVNGTLVINASGIVLRGAGQGANGTVLTATAPYQHDLIRVQGTGAGIVEVAGTRRAIASPRIPTGTTSIPVNSTAGYSVGDEIAVTRTPNDAWIDALEMRQYNWTAASYVVQHERVVTAINGNVIHVNIPIVDPILQVHGGGHVAMTNVTGRLSRVGIESMRLESTYTHDEDEAHAWTAVRLRRATGCWIRSVTARFFGYSLVTIDGESNFNTVQDCAMLDPKSITTGMRKYSFCVDDGIGNLFQRCFSRGGRHDFVTGARVTGPNAWVDCLAVDTRADIGPHHRWATGILFDNVRGGDIIVQNRRASGTGHGWAGAQVMFWNVDAVDHHVMVDSPFAARNWGIGCKGAFMRGEGYWELHGRHVVPRSLYFQQLRDRLGESAVNAVAAPEQLAGGAWALLAAWAGEGPPPFT